MQIQNFLDRYRQGERDFAHVDLSGVNLSGVNLRDIDLTGANLTGTCLSWTSLHHAKLTGAALGQADLRSANLNSANLDRANLSRAIMSKVDLRLATLQDADLNWAVLQEADLSGANLQRAKLDQINLERAKLNGTQLIEAELMEANLLKASLIGANLSGANLRDSHLEEANLREAILIGTNLTEANLSAAYIRSANLSEADLHRAILTNADLSEANLNNADLSRANLTGAYLLKASLRKTSLLRAILQDVYLLRADLSEANLRGADLRRADLSGAYLREAILSEANLSEAFLIESYLINTNLDRVQMTGCCINNWHLENVDLSKVECRYIFTKFNHITKSSADRYPEHRDFEPEEFSKYQEGEKPDSSSASTVEIYWQEAPNWEVLVFTLTQVELETTDLRLSVKSYEQREDFYLLRLAANHSVNGKILAQRVLQLYPEMLQMMRTKRETILEILQIKTRKHSELNSNTQDGSVSTLSAQQPPLPSPSSSDRRLQVYQEVVSQIQRIILSQAPEQFVNSVQRLLEFLKSQGISTQEIQKTIICQAILKRAKHDRTFYDRLIKWQATANETARTSIVGEAVRSAIAQHMP